MKKLSVVLMILMLGTAALTACSKSSDIQLQTRSETKSQWGLTLNSDGTEADTESAEESGEENPVVELDDGVLLLEVDDTQVEAVSPVNVRSGPGTGYDKVGGLSGSEEVTMTGICSNEWIRIDFDGEDGYVSMSYLTSADDEVSLSDLLAQVQALKAGGSDESSSNESSANESSSNEISANESSSNESSADESSSDKTGESGAEDQMAWAVTDVNVRKGPKAAYDVLGHLAQGEGVKVLDSTDAWWWKVEFNGQEAYVSAQYLTTEKPAE